MASSLSIFKIFEIKKEELKDNFTIPQQQSFADIGLTEEINSPKSIFKKIKENEEIISFTIKHYSDTIQNPIRIYWETLEENSPFHKGTHELGKGYQEIYNIPLIINLKENEIYIFGKKDVALNIAKRINKSKIMKIEAVNIDLSRIDESPEVNNIWGIWEDGTGRCKKKALFGVKVNEENQHESERTTSYNLEYEYSGGIIDLIISRSGVISSRSKEVRNEDLLEIYRKIKELQDTIPSQ